MGNGPLPDDADFIAASAVAALAIAVTGAQRVKDDPVLAAWVREIGELPSWRDDADAWARRLHTIQAKYAHPSDAELAGRTIEQSLFNRVRSCARDAVFSRDPRARHFSLSMASIAAGSLLGVVSGATAQTVIEAAVSAALAERAAHANSNRGKVKAMREVRDVFLAWQKAPGQRPEWRSYKDFGRWAEETYELDAATVARKAGEWAKGAH